MSIAKNQKKTKKRKTTNFDIFLCLLGLHIQDDSVLNNHRFNLFCSGNDTEKADFRYLLIQEGYITRQMLPTQRAKNGFMYHKYTITEEGLNYLKNSLLYKRCNIPDKIDNKTKFALISIFEKLKGYSAEFKVQTIFYYFSSVKDKTDPHKLTSMYLYGSDFLISKEQVNSSEYKKVKACFVRIILKIKIFILGGTSILLKKNNIMKRIDKSISHQKKAKSFFICKFLTCASATIKKVFKNFTISPIVKNTKSLLKRFFGTIPLGAIFQRNLKRLEQNPTREQCIASLLECDRYLQMGALLERAQFEKIITKQPRNLSDFEKQRIIGRSHIDNGLSQYIVQDLQIKKLEKKTYAIIETTFNLRTEEKPLYDVDIGDVDIGEEIY